MNEPTLERRRALALELLLKLKEIRNHVEKLMNHLGDSSGDLLSTVYQDHKEKVQEKVDLFNGNIEKVRELNLKKTALYNEWFIFIKDAEELKNPLFPFHLLSKRKKIKKELWELKEEISAIGIRNRLIREDILRLEGDMEYEATLRLKKDVRYEDYLSHLKMNGNLLDEVRYLIPTLPGVSITEIDMDRLDETIGLIQDIRP